MQILLKPCRRTGYTRQSKMCDDKSEKGDTRRKAGNLPDNKEELEFAFILEFWSDILERFQKTSKSLQAEQITPSACTKLYKSLLDYVSNARDKCLRQEHKSDYAWCWVQGAELLDGDKSTAAMPKKSVWAQETRFVLKPLFKWSTRLLT